MNNKKNNSRAGIDYEQLATELAMHIKFYIPAAWKKKIDEYHHGPLHFSAEEAEILSIGNKIGALEKAMRYVFEKNHCPGINRTYIKDAIRDFFWER